MLREYNIDNHIDAILEMDSKIENEQVTYDYVPSEQNEELYMVTVRHCITGTNCKKRLVEDGHQYNLSTGDTYSTGHYNELELNGAKYTWDNRVPSNAEGTIGSSDVIVTYYYKINVINPPSNQQQTTESRQDTSGDVYVPMTPVKPKTGCSGLDSPNSEKVSKGQNVFTQNLC